MERKRYYTQTKIKGSKTDIESYYNRLFRVRAEGRYLRVGDENIIAQQSCIGQNTDLDTPSLRTTTQVGGGKAKKVAKMSKTPWGCPAARADVTSQMEPQKLRSKEWSSRPHQRNCGRTKPGPSRKDTESVADLIS